jgi:hypothetical protein
MLLITATMNRSSESLPTSSSARSAESTHGSYLADQPETGGVSPSGVNHGCVPVTGAVAAVDARKRRCGTHRLDIPGNIP